MELLEEHYDLTNTFESELLPSLGSSAIGDNSIRDMVRKSTSEPYRKMLFTWGENKSGA
jgi:hypothetical protein